MTISRRTALTLIPAVSLVGGVQEGHAQSSGAPGSSYFGDLLKPEDDPEFGRLITGSPSTGGSVVGTAPARHEEIRIGTKLLLDAPRGKTLVQTARYFESISQKNKDGELYNAEWQVRANPLITGFFAMTGTAPSAGDQTSWCAAFVSMCLYLANLQNAYTALSGGYRKYGTTVSNSPKEGDLAVFSNHGESGAKGFGHIGIFLKEESRSGADGVLLIGGNQRGDTGTTGAVTEAWYPLQGKGLSIHSIRRVRSV